MAITRAAGYGSLSGGYFIPEIWSLKTRIKFYKTSVASDIINRDYEGEIKKKGDTVHIRKFGDLTVGDYEVGGGIQWQDLPDEKQTLTIDYAKYVAFKVDDIDAVQADINAIQGYTEEAAYRLKDTFDQFILGLYTGADSSNTYGSDASPIDCGYDTGEVDPLAVMNRLNRLLDEQDVPSDGRWFVAPPIYWEQVLDVNSKVIDASFTGDNKSPLRTNMVGRIRGFKCYRSNNVSNAVNGSGDTVYRIMAGTKHAISGAMQITKTESVRIQDGFETGVKMLMVYGGKVIVPEALSVAYVKID